MAEATDGPNASDASNGAVRVEVDRRGVATVTLHRPDVHNAMNAEVIAELHRRFDELGTDDEVRVIVLTGAGRSFSAGADLTWMRGMVDNDHRENLRDSGRLDEMLRAIQDCPHPVVARVNGHCLGGGVGLVAAADVAIAVSGARFGFTEVRLGLAPAVISTYVLPKIGLSQARRLFLTGERFDAATAAAIDLVHEVVEPDALDEAVEATVGSLLAGGPVAQGEVKQLLHELPRLIDPGARSRRTVELIASLRVSQEGQEGMAAFFEDREPAWRAGSGGGPG